MKMLLSAVALLISWIAGAAEPRADAGTAKWLQSGCAVLAAGTTPADFRKLPLIDVQNATIVSFWLDGYLDGVNSSLFLDEKSVSDLLVSAEGWQIAAIRARSLLTFMEKYHDKIQPQQSAKSVVTAWYLHEHPKSSAEQKSLSINILQDMDALSRPRAIR